MTTLVKRVRRALDSRCQINHGVRKDGCKIPMKNMPDPHLIIDFDKPGSPLAQDETRCDFLVIANSHHDFDWVVPLELKRGDWMRTGSPDNYRLGLPSQRNWFPKTNLPGFSLLLHPAT